MTLVKVLITQYNSQGVKVGSLGQITFTPTRAQVLPGDPDNLVLPEPFSVKLVNGAASVNLDPSTNEWAYKVSTIIVGANKIPDKYVTVPNVASIDFTDLTEVDPATLTQVAVAPAPVWYTYVDGLELTAQEAANTATEMAATLIPVKESVDASKAATLAAEANALGHASAASTSAQAAATSRSGAQSSAATALASEQASLASKGAAEASAASASTSASTATQKASDASSSASSALASASSASTDAATVASQISTATQKASEAATSAASAGQSATTATDRASAAQTSASEALASRNTASTKAGESASSAAASAASATASEASRSASETARTGAEAARTGSESAAATATSKAAEANLNATGFDIGTITTVPNAPAGATITGTAPDRRLNLDLPVSELSIGTVTTGTTGTPASAAISGAFPSQKLDLQIPLGPATQLSIGSTVTGPDVTGPQGLKGDPGGWVLGTPLGVTNLDTVLTPGLYSQSNGSYVNTANGYPLTAGMPVVLKVVGSHVDNSRIEQEVNFLYNTSNPTSRAIYKRTIYAGVISAWRVFASQRVDNTAGRAIYTWDDTANREQLVYGDTGLRNVTSLGATISAGSVFVTRYGKNILVNIVNLRINDAAGATTVLTLPDGFRPQMDTYAQNINEPTKRFYLSSNGSLMILNHTDPTHVYGATMFGMTVNAWPTTLPGSASGSIPNL